jgi:hypothetical protein
MAIQNPERMTADELRAAFNTLTKRLDNIDAGEKSITERLDYIDAAISEFKAGLLHAATQPATPAEQTPDNTVTFTATSILVGMDDNGQPTYKAKGGQYTKFGVRIWGEVLQLLGIDPATLNPGQNPVNLRVIALLGENGPRKIIGLAK